MKPLMCKNEIKDIKFGEDCKIIVLIDFYEYILENNVLIGSNSTVLPGRGI